MQEPCHGLFRQTLSRFATGVCVITVLTPEGSPVGMTVNAFTSVSLDPPFVLFCLKKAAARYPLFAESTRYSISILAENQQALSHHFATQSPSLWDAVGQTLMPGFAPFLKETLAQIACEKSQVYPGGDHDLYLARVVSMDFDPSKKPLVFFGSQYNDLAPKQVLEDIDPLAPCLKAS